MENTEQNGQGPCWAYFALTALSLSVGWGIRGNFGHEYGAMIPGGLAALAIVALSGRPDWHLRAAYFAMFGAIGWSFGGSISYMQVIAYTHSGHSPSVLYGFACLFVIGFLWAAPGGAGTAFAAFADRERLTSLFAPMTVVFVTWAIQGTFIEPWLAQSLGPDNAKRYLNWYDSDWLGALSALVVMCIYAAYRRRVDLGTSLILHMSVGWWIGFLVLVNVLGLRMTPPRGDNWAGCLGMTAGLILYFIRTGLTPVANAALVTGFIGGIGFAGASMLKLVEVTSGYETNWHSILEQTTGLFNGLAVAIALARPARLATVVSDQPPLRRKTEVYAVAFVLLLITYVNLRKNVPEWIRVKAMPPELYGIPTHYWFNLAYIILAVVLIVSLLRHLRRPLAFLSLGPLGRCQWLYMVFLWWMVVGNFERALVGFASQRLVTEGVIFLNAGLCTLLLVLPAIKPITPSRIENYRLNLAKTLVVGFVVASVAVLIDWGVVRVIYGDRFAGHANLHIRFGPNATVAKPNFPR